MPAPPAALSVNGKESEGFRYIYSNIFEVEPHAPEGFARFDSAQDSPTPASALHPPMPRCLVGDAPGAWIVHQSMYGDHPGEVRH